MSKAGALTALLGISLLTTAEAQVGHPPDASPYRDLPARSFLSATSAFVGGSSGKLGIGPHMGWAHGGRVEFRISSALDVFFGAALGNLERWVVDPEAPAESRYLGQIDQSVYFVDAGITLLLTGNKSWRGFVPYAGGAMGIASGGFAEDASGFKFHWKWTVGPHAGLRYHVSPRIMLRAETRMLLWRLSYPARFYEPPEIAPSDPPLLNPQIDRLTDWTSHPVLMFGLGYAFRL